MGIADKRTCAAVHIGKEISKNMDRGFALWKRREKHAVHVELHCPRSKSKFESFFHERQLKFFQKNKAYSSAFIQPSSSACATIDVLSTSAPAAITAPYLL